MVDFDYPSDWDFKRAMDEITKTEWQVEKLVANKYHSGKMQNLFRVFIYAQKPLKIFLNRKNYRTIYAWQQFYCLLYAFYCRLFHVKKVNNLVLTNMIYKPRKGKITSKIYKGFWKYVIDSKYIDTIICASQANIDMCCKDLDADKSKFAFLHFGVEDITKRIDTTRDANNDYILALGRSNRDWDFLIESLKDTEYDVKIVCDTLQKKELPKNITIYDNVHGNESFEFIYNCKCMFIPILDGNVASGETVICQTMAFGKPIIITKPSSLADGYVTDGVNGFVISKNRDELLTAVHQIYDDESIYCEMTKNSREQYVKYYSLYTHGVETAKLLLNRDLV